MSCISLEGGTDFENDALICCIMGNVGCSIFGDYPRLEFKTPLPPLLGFWPFFLKRVSHKSLQF